MITNRRDGLRKVLWGAVSFLALVGFIYDFDHKAGIEHPWLWALGIVGSSVAIWGLGELITDWFARPEPLEDKK